MRKSSASKRAKLPWFYRVTVPSNLDPALLIRQLKVPGFRRRHPFETVDQCEARNRVTLRRLAKSPAVGRKLMAPGLGACRPPEDPCGLAICHVCLRQYRRAMISQILPHLQGKMSEGCRAHLVTLIYSKPELRTRRLTLARLDRLQQRLRVLLQDYGLGDLMIAGSIEWDWHERDQVWEPHLHLIVMTKSRSVLKTKLRRHFKPGNGVRQPNRVSKAVDPVELPRALAYTLKFDPKIRSPRKRSDTSRRKRKPIDGYERYKSKRWLFLRGFDAFTYLQGMQRQGITGPNPRIEPTNRAPKGRILGG